MLKSDDIFKIVLFFLLGIFLSCVVKKACNYEGFEYDTSYSNDMFINDGNMDVDGKRANYNCNLFVSRSDIRKINDQNGLWWDKMGWYAVIMNDPMAYEEMKRDFEADITDPLLIKGTCKNNKVCSGHQFFVVYEKTINAIRDKFEDEIKKLYNKIKDEGNLEILMDPMFISPVDTQELYLNNFKETVAVNLEELAPLNNWDDDSLWTSYRNIIEYISFIELSDDDEYRLNTEIFGYTEDSEDSKIIYYIQDKDSEMFDKAFPKVWFSDHIDVTATSCSGSIHGLTYEKQSTVSIPGSESCYLIFSCSNSVPGLRCAVRYRKALYDKIVELKNFVIGLDIRKVGYMEEYKRLLNISGEKVPEEMIPYLDLFENMLKNGFPDIPVNLDTVRMVRLWGQWSTTYGLINNKPIASLYNIPSKKEYDKKCSRQTEERRCYFNSGNYDLKSDIDIGRDVVSDAWGQMYENYGTRDNKTYLPPYLVQNNAIQIKNLETLNERTCNMINPGGWRYTSTNDPTAEKNAEDNGEDKLCYIDGGDKGDAQAMIELPDYRNCEKYSPINGGNIEDIEDYIIQNYNELITLIENETELEKYVIEKMDMYVDQYRVEQIIQMIKEINDNYNSEGYYNYY